ncbi:MAG: C1 family peptidase, partial [Candidatus Sericytochromatia bacterium]|nr:C1 family peptidase [Candidatus Sericytochromatia bacterium]
QPIELSPGFIYLWELKKEGTLGTDEGANISTGMDVLRDQGIAPEERFPYLTKAEQLDGSKVHTFVSMLPSLAVNQAARAFKETTVTAVPDLNGFKAALAKRKTIAFGISCFKSFESDAVKKTGIVPLPDAALEPFMGGHAILAVGYDDSKQHIIFRNSYGTAWGDKGYGYLPYTYFKADWVGDAWIAD